MPSPLGFDLNPAMIAQILLEAKRQKIAGEGAKVGAAPFGMPSLPQLAPQPGAPEMRSSNTPMGDRYGQMTGSPTIGKVMSGVDRAGDVARNYAMAPMDTMDAGTKRLAEAQHEGDWIKGAGGLTQAVAGGASMIPGAAGALYGSIPRSLATGTAFGLAPMAAAGMFSSDAEAAGLTKKQQRDIEMQRQRLEIESTATAKKLKIEEEAAKRKREADRQASLQAIKDAEDEHKRQFGQTFAAEHPVASLGMQVGGTILGALLGRRIKTAGAADYNNSLRELVNRSQTSVNRAEAVIGKGSKAARAETERMVQQAEGLQQEIETLKKKGPSGGWAPLGLSLAGSEVGSSLPAVIDKQTKGITPDWWETGKRFGIGSMLGTTAGLISAESTPPLANPPGYSAETNALRGALDVRSKLERRVARLRLRRGP